MFAAQDPGLDLLVFAAMGAHQTRSVQKQAPSEDEILDLDSLFIVSSNEAKFSATATESSLDKVVKCQEASAFTRLLDDTRIAAFLRFDSCRRISDKYLLAMVFTYFKRARYHPHEYTRRNFFVALYLANDMEEDDEDFKYDIFPWALGRMWRRRYSGFLTQRDRLWERLGYRAAVSKRCCDEIMRIEPMHVAWRRTRPRHHGGAPRVYRYFQEDEEIEVRGPENSPRVCDKCLGSGDSGYIDAEASWYLSQSDSSGDGDSSSSSIEVESSPEYFHVEPGMKRRKRRASDVIVVKAARLEDLIDDSDSIFPQEEE